MNTDMRGFERDTVSAVINSKRVWLVHAVANALLMIAFFYWVLIPEETGWQVALSVLGAVIVVFCTLWLHCATFDYFSMVSEQQFRTSLRRSLARIPAFLVWAILVGVVLWLIGQLSGYDEQTGGYAHHSLFLALRKTTTPQSMSSAAHWGVWFLYFLLWPILVLPLGGQVAVKNFRGFWAAAALRPIRRWRFWIAYLVCFVVGAYLPYTLAWMVPRKPSPLSDQTWSMVLRLGFGYLLLVTAWVILCAAVMRASVGRGSVTRSQPGPLEAGS